MDGIARVLVPGGLFFWGQYGGVDREGPYADDHYEPKRFFSLLTDGALRAAAGTAFEELSFATVDLGDDTGDGIHFQALTLRRR